MREVAWSGARWLNEPPAVRQDDGQLVVTTGDHTDFWRVTAHGFVADNGHALLTSLPQDTAVEVAFVADVEQTYDQAGVLVRVGPRRWLKAGVELADGVPQLGAVATDEVSDWSLAPAPDWVGREVTVAVHRVGDALTVRARTEEHPWRTIRQAPFPTDAAAEAGPYCCSPTRAGLTVRFTRFAVGPAGD